MPTYHVSPAGSNANDGALSTPWQTITYAVAQLAPGDTLLVRGNAGPYYEREITIAVAGTAGLPVTIKGYPGDTTPVINGCYPELAAIGNSLWEVYNAGKSIYRTIATTYTGDAAICAKLPLPNGDLISIMSYQTLSWLESDNHNWAAAATPRYLGPGVHRGSDNRIYIRLVPPTTAAVIADDAISPASGPGLALIAASEVDQLPGWPSPSAADLNPANHALLIAPGGDSRGIRPDGTYVTWDGINLDATRYTMRGDASNWTIKNCRFRPGFSGIIRDNVVPRLLLDRVEIDSGLPSWIGRLDVKGDGEIASRLRVNGISCDVGAELEAQNCLFRRAFDGFTTSGDATLGEGYLKIHHCHFDGMADDTVQLSARARLFEFHHNRCTGVGLSWDGNSGSTPPLEPGLKFIHHNIFDNTNKMLWCRNDPLDLRTADEQGWQYPLVFSSHTGTATAGDPWKIYNNTFAFGTPVTSLDLEITSWLANSLSAAHEVMNNIFVQEAGTAARIHSAAKMTSGKEIHDGNLYYSAVGAPATLLLNFTRGDANIVVTDHANFQPGVNDDFTITGWVKRQTTASAQGFLLRGSTTTGKRYRLLIHNNGRMYLQLRDGTTAVDSFSSASLLFDTNVWLHFAAVVNRATDQVTMYRAGVQSGTPTSIAAIGDVIEPGSNLVIGNGGKIGLADLRFYRRTLTLAEIGNLAAFSTEPSPGPVARWPLNVADATTADDIVGSHDAPITAAETYSGPLWIQGPAGGATVAPLFFDTTSSYATLAALRDSQEADQTQRYYAPGWEAASVEGINPQLHATTRVPEAGAAVHADAVELWTERPSWPGVSDAYALDHRGAFLPGATGAEVGIPAPSSPVIIGRRRRGILLRGSEPLVISDKLLIAGTDRLLIGGTDRLNL